MGGKTLAGLSILVVDDDVPSRKLHALVLTLAGASVRGAATAEEAVAMVAVSVPDLIVLDLHLPQRSGHDLLVQLKNDGATQHIVVIAVTSTSGPDTEQRLLDAGCAAYMRKPIDTETFAATVANHRRGK